MKISLNVVACDEEGRIGDCIRDASHYVDEIVVVVQESRDKTLEEARAAMAGLPGKVLLDKRHGYCEASRKHAADASTGDWILVLDADEKMSDELRANLRSMVERPRTAGYRLLRELWMDGKFSWKGDRQYRLFRTRNVLFLDEIHTEPQPNGLGDVINDLEWVGIMHSKTMVEQLADEKRCLDVLTDPKHPQSRVNPHLVEAKLALNVNLNRGGAA